MNYSLQTLWHERSRYLPGVLAVGFSAVLIALQCGLLLGLFSITSIPIDHTRGDVWVGSPKVLSVDLGRPIPLTFLSRIAGDRRVDRVESYYQAFGNWTKPDGGSDLCIVIGSDLNDGNIGSVAELTPEMRVALTQPGSVVVDEAELDRLGVKGIGSKAEINKHSVEIVGLVKGMKSLAGPYVFCSRQTAREVLRMVMPSDHATYYLVKCRNKDDAPQLVADLRTEYGQDKDMSSFTSEEFSVHSRLHWLLKTKAGIAIGYAAILGLLVGMVVTSQTLYAATTAAAREYAILLALGIPRWRISVTVLVQSFWIGVAGVLVAYPAVKGLASLASLGGVNVLLPWWLLVGAAGVTMFMAMFSGILALRSVRRIEPLTLLR
jgi:putative ABC transport system permease protein